MEKLFLVVMAMVFTMPFFTGHTAEAAAKGRILLVASSQQTMALKNGTKMDVGFYLNELAVPAQYLAKQGYEISVVGESENTARYAGINVRRVTVRTMLISGAICGLCGFLIVAGKDQTISTASANGRGFTAIIVAWLAKFNTFYMALISFLLVFLERGASEIASAYSLNEYAADIITGIILFFILGSEFFINYRVIPRGAHKEGK
jgi:ABC-type uncharacterized transport system permease subunit